MKTWDQFYPFILADCLGVANPVIDNKLCLAARDFCTRTAAWVEWTDPISPTDEGQYDFDVPSHAEPVRIVRARLGSDESEFPIEAFSEQSVQKYVYPYQRHNRLIESIDKTGYTVHLRMTGEPLSLLVAFKPSLTAKGGADVLATLYADKIAAGAKAMVFAMPKYLDPAQIEINTRLYEDGVHSVANRAFAARPNKRTGKVYPS